jgi:phosphoglycolate phosphatase-like HAD superfamily hydrolase
MLTLLFDIDGTMVRAGGAGLMAMRQAIEELHGITDMPSVTVHGRTDHGIVEDIFGRLSIDVEPARATFVKRYCELLVQTLPQCSGRVLPNVVPLLDHMKKQGDVSLGLLTGNARRASDAKLDHFGLNHYFAYGGFGDDHSNRNDVAAVAKRAAADHLGDRFQEDQLWVIGDTVNDITCARSIGAKVIAVETGGGTRDELEAAGAELVYRQLPSIDQFLSDVSGF